MRAEPKDFELSGLIAALARAWGVRAASCHYVAVGGGSYHWQVADADGRQHWATLDDLRERPYLGHDPDAALDGLSAALETAVALRRAGLEFVVAPRPTAAGQAVERVEPAFALALYPFLDGTSHAFGELLDEATAMRLAKMLARLHTASGAESRRARALRELVPGRAELERALREADRPWESGPLAEPARAAVSAQRDEIGRLLDLFDELGRAVDAAPQRPVLTHGEPHPGNLMRIGDDLLLVDWDTAALAHPERDLWWIEGHPDALMRYELVTGRRPDAAAMRLYRLRWRLDDIASFVRLFRSPHRVDADTTRWLSFADSLTRQ